MTQIKVCGLKTFEAARCAHDAGADFLGFIFAPSRRQITAEAARTILKKLPPAAQTVGVFMDQSPEEVAEIAHCTGIRHIQLHGSEEARRYVGIGLPIIRSLPVTPEGVMGAVSLEGCSYALFDTCAGGKSGGSGVPFPWEAVSQNRPPVPFFVAGGLHPGNVAEAIAATNPFGVDVCSGVEVDGEKSLSLIRAFIHTVRRIR